MKWLHQFPPAVNPERLPSIQASNTFAKWDFDTAQADTQGNIISRPKKTAEYLVEDLGNEINLFMIKIPSGNFMMGSPALEAGRFDNEGKQRGVNVPSFFMSNFVVTQELYHTKSGYK